MSEYASDWLNPRYNANQKCQTIIDYLHMLHMSVAWEQNFDVSIFTLSVPGLNRRTGWVNVVSICFKDLQGGGQL